MFFFFFFEISREKSVRRVFLLKHVLFEKYMRRFVNSAAPFENFLWFRSPTRVNREERVTDGKPERENCKT